MPLKLTPITEPPARRRSPTGTMQTPVQRKRLTLRPLGLSKDQEAFGELEFLSELASSGSQDDLAKLGTKVAGAALYHNKALAGEASFYPPNLTDKSQRWFASFEGKYPTLNTIYTGSARNVPAVQNHEFRHAGIQYIVDNYSTKDAGDRWGEGAGELLAIFMKANEAAVEVFDDPEDPELEGTIQFDEALSSRQKELVKTMSKDIANDIMSDLGVPPQTQPKEQEEEGFFAKILNLFGD